MCDLPPRSILEARSVVVAEIVRRDMFFFYFCRVRRIKDGIGQSAKNEIQLLELLFRTPKKNKKQKKRKCKTIRERKRFGFFPFAIVHSNFRYPNHFVFKQSYEKLDLTLEYAGKQDFYRKRKIKTLFPMCYLKCIVIDGIETETIATTTCCSCCS